ncbi:MAG: putative porin [Anaerohalosphaeraceae bacterium]|nr:putative porin [Anaerohalosphaeraceae bacterium]
MKKWIVLVICLLFSENLVWAVSNAEFAAFKEQMALMQQRIEQLEVQQSQQDIKIDASVAKAVETRGVGALPDSLKWASRMNFSGDFRYRHEYQSDKTANRDRKRNRIRARLQLDAKVNNEWDLGFRIATGSSDSPTSTNQTLGGAFESKDIWLDLGYAKYHPAAYPGFELYMGKMKNPFYRVGKNQLIWDGDVTPEGIAIKYQRKISDATTLHANAGGFWLQESTGAPDSGLFAAQVYAKHKFESGNYLLGGASHYHFSNVGDENLLAIGANGNVTNADGTYISGFEVTELFSEYGFKMGEMPIKVYGNFVKNGAANNSRDSGWLVGFALNKAKAPGTWALSYDYRDVEADAVLGGLNDSDFAGGLTDSSGHRVGLKYAISKNTTAGLTYFMTDKNAHSSRGDDKYRMLQADLVFKF